MKVRLSLTALSVVLISATACPRTAALECYPVDPFSPVVLSQVDPIAFTRTDYCGRGATEVDGLDRHIAAYCVPKPETDPAICDPSPPTTFP